MDLLDPVICVSYTSKCWETHLRADLCWNIISGKILGKLKKGFYNFVFLPTGLLPSLDRLKPARCRSLPSMQCSTKALKNCTQLSLLPGHQSSSSAEPEPGAVLFWQHQPWAHLTWCVLARIGANNAGGREGTFVQLIHFSSSRWPMCRMSFPFFSADFAWFCCTW